MNPRISPVVLDWSWRGPCRSELQVGRDTARDRGVRVCTHIHTETHICIQVYAHAHT